MSFTFIAFPLTTWPLLLAFLFCISPNVVQFVRSDSVYIASSEYASGSLGSGPYQSFFSSNSTPPVWNFVQPTNKSTTLNSGYFFTSPRGTDTVSKGAYIYDNDGKLVWDASFYGETLVFQVEEYLGEPHILVWQGTLLGSGVGSGHLLLIDKNYQLVANFTTNLDGITGKTYADFHEGRITTNNTALMTAYQIKSKDLSAYDGPSDGYLFDSVLQEVNITSGEAIFTWAASDYVDPGDCYNSIGTGGTSTDSPWDYFHINSIEKTDDGNYLISSRHCSAIYYLDGTNGDIIWRMGGMNSSFTMNNGTDFSWQHHARWIERNDTYATMTLFDNAGEWGTYNENSSRGLFLSLNFTSMDVDLIQDVIPWNVTVSESQGSMQRQPNGDFLVGWGYQPWYSEYSSTGEMLWSAQFGVVGGSNNEAYRMLRFNWTGEPTASPDISIIQSSANNIMSVYASWNGDTRTEHWELLGADDDSGSNAVSLYNATRSGFETTLTLNTAAHSYSYYAVRSIGPGRQALGRSDYTKSTGDSNGAADAAVTGAWRTILSAALLVWALQTM